MLDMSVCLTMLLLGTCISSLQNLNMQSSNFLLLSSDLWTPPGLIQIGNENYEQLSHGCQLQSMISPSSSLPSCQPLLVWLSPLFFFHGDVGNECLLQCSLSLYSFFSIAAIEKEADLWTVLTLWPFLPPSGHLERCCVCARISGTWKSPTFVTAIAVAREMDGRKADEIRAR